MSSTNPSPVDLERIVLVREEDGTVRHRRDDEQTDREGFHTHFVISRATAVRARRPHCVTAPAVRLSDCTD